MKQAIAFGRKLAVGAALSLMLGAASTAQRAARAPSLELTVHLMGNDDIDPRAVIPLAADLGKVLTLSGGAPGSMALIELGRAAGRGGRSFVRCGVFTGPFGPTGQFEVVIPPSIDVRGLGARGAQAPTRMVTVVLDLDDAVEEAFVTWESLGSLPKPQGGFSGGGRVRTPGRIPGHLGQATVRGGMVTRAVDNGDEAGEAANSTSWENLGSLPKPQGGFSGGGRVRSPGRIAGHLGQATVRGGMVTREVDNGAEAGEAANSTSWENLGSLPKPQGGFSGGGRVRSPGRIAGHLGQATVRGGMVTREVDNGAEAGEAANSTSWENLGRLPKPQGAVSAGGHSQGGGGVIVCPANLPLISIAVLGDVAQPRRAGTPGGNSGAGPGHAARRDRP